MVRLWWKFKVVNNRRNVGHNLENSVGCSASPFPALKSAVLWVTKCHGGLPEVEEKEEEKSQERHWW